MNTRPLIAGLIFTLATGMTTTVFSQDQQPIYGSQLMTKQERIEHRNRLRNANSAEEREKIRKEHHERMKIRAREKGVELPDQPPARGGKGMGPSGRGMGAGAGMKQGGGKGNRQ